MNEFLKFRVMIAPVVIQVLFWIGVAGCIIVGIIGFFSSIAAGDFGGVLGSLLVLVLGPIGVRVYAELLLILFRIYETLVDIKNK